MPSYESRRLREAVRRPQPRREAIDSAHIAAIPESRTRYETQMATYDDTRVDTLGTQHTQDQIACLMNTEVAVSRVGMYEP